jgi:hypothetical protein
MTVSAKIDVRYRRVREISDFTEIVEMLFPGNAVKWTRLSCREFKDNQVRLQLFALAYNLGNFLRRLALPRSVRHWSLTTLREKLVKIGAKVVRHSRYVIFQLAEVAVPRKLFAAILARIQRLAPAPT